MRSKCSAFKAPQLILINKQWTRAATPSISTERCIQRSIIRCKFTSCAYLPLLIQQKWTKSFQRLSTPINTYSFNSPKSEFMGMWLFLLIKLVYSIFLASVFNMKSTSTYTLSTQSVTHINRISFFHIFIVETFMFVRETLSWHEIMHNFYNVIHCWRMMSL